MNGGDDDNDDDDDVSQHKSDTRECNKKIARSLQTERD
jgi:hypothetical protein